MDDKWMEVCHKADIVCMDSWDVCSHRQLKEASHGRVMTNWEMTPLYVPDSGLRPSNTNGLFPHFVVLHRMLRRTLAPRICDANTILTYEWNLLDAIMMNEHFDAFDYIINEIWNISINPL
jgi:hypothetical protein